MGSRIAGLIDSFRDCTYGASVLCVPVPLTNSLLRSLTSFLLHQVLDFSGTSQVALNFVSVQGRVFDAVNKAAVETASVTLLSANETVFMDKSLHKNIYKQFMHL